MYKMTCLKVLNTNKKKKNPIENVVQGESLVFYSIFFIIITTTRIIYIMLNNIIIQTHCLNVTKYITPRVCFYRLLCECTTCFNPFKLIFFFLFYFDLDVTVRLRTMKYIMYFIVLVPMLPSFENNCIAFVRLGMSVRRKLNLRTETI